jgi:hypothetical protein
MNDDGNAVGSEKDILLTIKGKWFSRLAILSKPVGGAIQAVCAIVRWRRRGRVIAKGYTRRDVGSGVMAKQELDAFIVSALEILPQRTPSTEDARAVLMGSWQRNIDRLVAATSYRGKLKRSVRWARGWRPRPERRGSRWARIC